jgi:chromosome segregation protein
VYISRVILRNFKSFKNADIRMVNGVNALAGPNGSGKSNICDAIRFILGETSLKALRADSTKHLIHYGTQSASVSLSFGGTEEMEILRDIDKDGTTEYRLNGKKLTGKELQNFLIKKGLYSPRRVVIGQGEINKVADLKPKELREYIDDLAGISEYEMKRQEALKELEAADQRIKEANLVLGERLKYLDELKAEMDRAEAYAKMKQELDDIKYTLTYREIERIRQEEARCNKKKDEATVTKDETLARLADVRNSIQKIMDDRVLLNKEVEEKVKRNELYKAIETLKADIAVRKEAARNLDEKERMFSEQLSAKNAELSGLQTKAVELDDGIRQSKAEAANINVDKIRKDDEKLAKIRAELETKSSELHAREVESASLSSSISKDGEMLSIKEGMLDELISSRESAKDETAAIERDLKTVEKESMALFEKEKRLNVSITESDKKTIRLRERIAIMRASAGTQKVNPALHYVDELKSSGKVEGIYGKVIDLIQFDEKFAEAVEASAAGRLNYVVVSDQNAAREVIEFLKDARIGRVTIIPLAEIRVNVSTVKEGIGMLRDFVTCDALFTKAIEYVFGDTVVVNTFDEGKRLSGRHRTVTMDGTLFESSGVVTGGKSTSSLAVNKALSSAEQELDAVRIERESQINQLKEVKDAFSKNRDRKAQLEARLASFKEGPKEGKPKASADQLKEEVFNARQLMEKQNARLSELAKETESIRKEMEKLTGERDRILEKLNIQEAEYEKQALEKTSLKAMLVERAKNYGTEKESMHGKIAALQKEIKEIESKTSGIEKERRAGTDTLRMKEGELVAKETEMGRGNQLLNQLMDRTRQLEKELQDLGAQEKSLSERLAKAERDIGKIDVDLASVGTRMEDLERSIESYRNATLLEAGRLELEKRMKELEESLAVTQSINFAAKETYYRLYDEVGEIKERLEKLKVEKDSIIQLMDEVNKRKKEAFFATHNSVKKNFEELFSRLHHFGSGTISLDNEEDPFESGLHIKVIRNSKEISLHALSGGEKTVVSLMFIFAMLFVRPSPFYVLDEVDASLDKLNSERMIDLINGISSSTQFILVSHNEIVLGKCQLIVGVAKTTAGSKIVEVRNKQESSQ